MFLYGADVRFRIASNQMAVWTSGGNQFFCQKTPKLSGESCACCLLLGSIPYHVTHSELLDHALSLVFIYYNLSAIIADAVSRPSGIVPDCL